MQETFICIAGITVKLISSQVYEEEGEHRFRYEHFVFKDKPGKVDIVLDLTTIPRYRRFKQKPLFETRRDEMKLSDSFLRRHRDLKQDNRLSKEAEKYLGPGLDWRIAKVGKRILIEGGTSGRYQLLINEELSKGKISIINPDNRWKITDIIYGFLQVLIIYYISKRV